MKNNVQNTQYYIVSCHADAKMYEEILFSLKDHKVKLYDIDIAGTAVVSLSYRTCKWSVITVLEKNAIFSCFTFMQGSEFRSKLCSMRSFANKLLGTWNSILQLSNMRSVVSAPLYKPAHYLSQKVEVPQN